MDEIYKPFNNLNRYTEFEYLRYHGKLKNFCFIISKSPKNTEGFEDKDPTYVFPHNQFNYAQIKNERFKGLINGNTMCITTQGNICTLIYDVDIMFTNNTDENQKMVASYLKNFRLLHKLISPLCHLKEDMEGSNGRKKTIKEEKKNVIDLKKIPYEQNLILKKSKKFEFNKGNADTYATVDQLKLFLEYFRSGEYVIDSVINYHNTGFMPMNNRYIESNEVQGHFAYKKDYIRGKNGGLYYLNTELIGEQKKVILSLLKQAGSNLIHGRSIMNVSLPLEVFEQRSFLERFARSFGHAPIFLEKAGSITNVIEQMKYTLCFFLSSIVLCIQQENLSIRF